MSSLKTLIFFATPEHPCSYLEGRQATTMFVRPPRASGQIHLLPAH